MRSANTRMLAVFALVTAAMVASTSGPVQAGKPAAKAPRYGAKLDRELQRRLKIDDDGRVRVIVKPAPGRHDATLQKHREHGDAVGTEFRTLDAFVMTIPTNQLAQLESDPDVASLSVNAVVP